MSIRISKGGRLFGIVAVLGGAVMIGGAALTWTKAVRVTYFLPYEISELNGAERIATLVLGLLVIARAACFITLGSRRVRITAGGIVVLAAAAGLGIAMLADPPSFAGSPVERPCQLDLRLPCIQTLGGDGRVLAGWGAILAAGYGIVALLRSGRGGPPDARGRALTRRPICLKPTERLRGATQAAHVRRLLARLDRVCHRDCCRRGLLRSDLEHLFGPHGVVLTALSGISEFPATGRTGSPRRKASRPQYKEASRSLRRTTLRLRDSTTPR